MMNGSMDPLKGRRRVARSAIWTRAGTLDKYPTMPCLNTYPGEAPLRAGNSLGKELQSSLLRRAESEQLHAYAKSVYGRFDGIVPFLRELVTLQAAPDFEERAQRLAQDRLGYALPGAVLARAWVDGIDMRALYAWSVFQAYLHHSAHFFSEMPLADDVEDDKFIGWLESCGFHTLDISPCSDGRLAHVIRYVLRLPYREVRRKSYAGAAFDIEDSVAKWVETEFHCIRGHSASPNGMGRYLKVVVYHLSGSAPDSEGCAAYGSDARRAAQAGLDRLIAFREALENTFCCGASVDLLLIGVDTDSDAIRVHVPDGYNRLDVDRVIEAGPLYEATTALSDAEEGRFLEERVAAVSPDVTPGMARLIATLLRNNFAQIDYVQRFHGKRYEDIGHAERFIGAGIGFEDIQLRNLTYFAYLHTVEEATRDLDVGVKIFSRLYVNHGLPIPVVVRFDYHGSVPGARERAWERCERVEAALLERYVHLYEQGLLQTLKVIRDCDSREPLQVLGCSLPAVSIEGGTFI